MSILQVLIYICVYIHLYIWVWSLPGGLALWGEARLWGEVLPRGDIARKGRATECTELTVSCAREGSPTAPAAEPEVSCAKETRVLRAGTPRLLPTVSCATLLRAGREPKLRRAGCPLALAQCSRGEALAGSEVLVLAVRGGVPGAEGLGFGVCGLGFGV